MTQTRADTEWINLKVSDGTEMRAYIGRPTDNKPRSGLIVFQEAFGVNDHIRNVVERFASRGFLTAAPELYHRTGPRFEGRYDDFPSIMPHMQALNDQDMAADQKAVFDWLANQEPVGALERADGTGKGPAISCIGYCMGGRASYLAAITLPLNCAVSYYGGGIAPNERNRGLLDRTSEIQCAVLLFWGGLDKHIGHDAYRAVEDSLIGAGKKYVQAIFSKADHGFACDARPSYNPTATDEALALALKFIEKHGG